MVLSLLSWVRNIAKFGFVFMFANFLILFSAVMIISYAGVEIYSYGINSDTTAVKLSGIWTMLGFSFYTFEGVGILMPVMQACDCPEKFESIFKRAILTLTGFYISFALICNLAWGRMQGKQIVTEMLPTSHTTVKVLLLAYVVMLVLGYPLTVNPTNTILESYTINRCLPRKGVVRKWSKNILRTLVCLSAAYVGIELSAYLDLFLGLLGSVICAPLAMIIPTFCHLSLVAKTPA